LANEIDLLTEITAGCESTLNSIKNIVFTIFMCSTLPSPHECITPKTSLYVLCFALAKISCHVHKWYEPPNQNPK
jgi:hypothetical protein